MSFVYIESLSFLCLTNSFHCKFVTHRGSIYQNIMGKKRENIQDRVECMNTSIFELL